MHVFITGCGRGIGAALTRDALTRGWQVSGTIRDHSDPFAGAATLYQVEMADPAAIATQLRNVVGPIDILINNAGVIGPDRQSTLDMDFEGFAETMAINVFAPLAVTQALIPRMSTGARVLALSSQMAWMGYAKSDRIAYRASKSALNKLFQGLATDLAPQGIAVGLIDPGWVQTDMGGSEAALRPEVVAQGILDLATTLTLDGSGKFYRYTGEERAF